ncbi:MAG: hypothetical protein P8Y29_06095 [Gemmatimonadota bacterium]
MKPQTKYRGEARSTVHHFMVCLLTEVKVGDGCVLEDVSQEVTGDDERQRPRGLQRQRLRQHPEQCDRQQEPGTDGDEELQHDAAPVAAYTDQQATDQVAHASDDCEQDTHRLRAANIADPRKAGKRR